MARWNRSVVASTTVPVIAPKPGLASLKLAPKVRNAFAVTIEVIATSTDADPAESVTEPV